MMGVVAASYVASSPAVLGPNYDQAVLARNPTAYYPLSTYTDLSGNGKTIAADAGTPALSTVGGPVLGGGLDSGRVTLDGASRLLTNVTPSNFTKFSICGWIKTTSTAYTNITSGRPNGVFGQSASIYFGGAPVNGGAAGTLAYGQSGDGAWSGRKTAETVHDGTWRWFMATFGSTPGSNPTSNWKIYLDGVLATMSDSYYGGDGSPVAGGYPFYLGGHPYDGGAPLTGELSRVAYFDGQELTATDAAEIFAAASAGGPAYVASTTTTFSATTGTKTAALPPGSKAGDLLTFHTAGAVPTSVPNGTGWVSVATGGNTITYKFLTAADITAGQITWTIGQNYGNAYASLSTFRGVGSVQQTSVTTGADNTDIVTPASGAVITGGLLVAIMGNVPPPSISQGPPAAPWTSRVYQEIDYQEVGLATRRADTANVTCTWPLTAWVNSTPYTWNATILRLLP